METFVTNTGRRVRVLIMGAGGRDFHNFNLVFRGDPNYEVVGFTAAQIPGIAGRRYPASLAGPLYPQGIAIFPEEELEGLIQREKVEQVVFSYSDVSHLKVMHIASRVLAAGASFQLLSPEQTMLSAQVPVISVCAVRTGAGKSPTSQWIAGWLRDHGHSVAVMRHPMPYGDLERQKVQRFASFADLDAADVTVEEREEYEPYLKMGVPVFAGVDYGLILAEAEREARVILWDGGNNDFPFLRSDLNLVVLDPHRAGHELAYHPGEVNFRSADAYILTKVDSASPEQIEQVLKNIHSINPQVPIVMADLGIIIQDPQVIEGKRVAIVGDGPTLTHGEMGFGAGTLAANRFQAGVIVDPRPYLQGGLEETFASYPHLHREIPALGYNPAQVRDLEGTLERIPADLIIDATPVDLSRLISISKPILKADYYFDERDCGLSKILKEFQERYLPES